MRPVEPERHVSDMTVKLIDRAMVGNYGLARVGWLRQLDEIRRLPIYEYPSR